MKLLAGTHYDPLTTRVQKSTASLLAMTAFDTTNLRLTFTAPSNGSVLVRMRTTLSGAISSAQVLLGVLDGATVRGRAAPITYRVGPVAAAVTALSYSATISGLTAGQSYTWDAAYGVELAVASTNIMYTGLDDATINNAYGGFSYEIWDTPGLLATAHYDPSTASTSHSVATAIAMTALDTTNLRLTFTAPSAGIVQIRLRGVVSGTTGQTVNTFFGILDGATVRGRIRPAGGLSQIQTTSLATDQLTQEGVSLVTGLVGGTSYTWDAAYGVEGQQPSGNVKFGGPDNTTQDDAWGGFAFDVWNVDSLPRAIGSVA